MLGLGDSVINGGAQTDQDSLATSLFSNETGIQMLNISAGSWGPDNCVAYLKEFGMFDASAVFLVVSSHDAHDNIDFSKPVVGVHPSYPDKQYPCALAEVIMRYGIPKLKKSLKIKDNKGLDPDQAVLSQDGTGIDKKGIAFNSGFEELRLMCERDSIPFVVYLHADKKENEAGRYNAQGREIIDWANRNSVRLIKELNHPLSKEDYRDGIHINNKGQRKLANVMEEVLINEYKLLD